jgi:hypothetical protein
MQVAERISRFQDQVVQLDFGVDSIERIRIAKGAISPQGRLVWDKAKSAEQRQVRLVCRSG